MKELHSSLAINDLNIKQNTICYADSFEQTSIWQQIFLQNLDRSQPSGMTEIPSKFDELHRIEYTENSNLLTAHREPHDTMNLFYTQMLCEHNVLCPAKIIVELECM